MTIHYALDSLALARGRLFGWGWLLSESCPVEHMELVVPGPGGDARLPCLRAGHRTDVAAAFPSIPHAGSAGFIVIGRVHEAETDVVARLVVRLENGDIHARELPGFPSRYLQQTARTTGLMARLRSARRQLRECGWRSFAHRLLQRAHLTAREWWERVAPRLNRVGSGPNVVVFDHAMGGGANRFRDEWVDLRVKEGAVVNVVTPRIDRLVYELREVGGSAARRRDFSDIPQLLAYLDRFPRLDVVLNNLVSYDAPLKIVQWAGTRSAKGSRLTFFLHDYFAACPSWTLVNDSGRYCRIPSSDACRSCLARNPVPFLSFYDRISIEEWRLAWGAVLELADEIVAFSTASARILAQAYPDLRYDRIIIRPHGVQYLEPGRTVTPNLSTPLVVAVIGHINEHKGSGIIRSLVDEVRRSGAPLRFKIFGSIDSVGPSELVEVLGPYKATELAGLLEQHGVGVCFLPSICPETFSYVTSEIIHFRMPIAVFNLGAPAERAGQYERGRVLTSMEPPTIVAELLEFGANLRRELNTDMQQAQRQDGK